MKAVEIRPIVFSDGAVLKIAEVKAGFPSPAADFTGETIDLNRELIRHPSTTFCARARGTSMKDAGISDGDLLIIDRSLEPEDGRIAVCYIDGEFTLKRIRKGRGCLWLVPANPDYKPIKVTPENDFTIWGILTHVIKSF